MTEPIGYVPLQVILSMQGVSGQLDSQLAGPLAAAGRSAGRDAGRAVATGLQQAQADVSRASSALAAARDKEADAAGKVRAAETRLQELRDSGRASASQLVRAEEALEAARRRSNRAVEATQSATQELTEARARAANATDDAVDAEGRFSTAMSNLRDRLGPATKEMLAAGAAAAGIGAAMVAASTAVETESLNDKLAAQLGASPEMAKEFGQIAGNLYAQAYGENLGQVNEALRNVWQQGLVSEDATTAEIEGVTASVLDLATAFDQDVNGAAAAVGTMLKTGMAPDAQAAMDILTRGFQQGADKGGDLLDTFIEYPALFEALGLSATEATGLLSQGLNAGAFNADKVADALKEFQIRATDGSETSAAAYERLGLNAADMTAKMAAGGEGAQEVLTTVLDRLRGIQGETDYATTAFGLFGTQSEDLAGSLLALDPGSAVQSLGQVDGAAAKLGETLNSNTATSIEEIKRSIQTGLGEALTSSVDWIKNNQTAATGLGIALGVLAGALVTAKVAAGGYALAQGVMAAATGAGTASLAANSLALGAYTVATGVIRGATLAWSGVQWVLNAALSANPIGAVVLVIGALIAGIVLAYKNSETFRAIVTAAWEGIKTAALWTWDNVLKPVFSWLGEAFQTAWNAAKAAGDGIAAAWTWISDKATEAKDWVVDTFNSFVDFVTGLPGRIRSAASGLWDGITDGFRSALNWLIGKWNSFSLGFDFNIPVINQRVSFQIDTPDLPLLAGGGVAGRTAAGKLWGPGTPTSDSILGVDAHGIPTALVSTDEGVVAKHAMDNGGEELVAWLNAGWVPPLDMLRAMLPGLAGGGIASGAGSLTPVQQGMWESIRNAFPEAQVTSATRTVDVGSGYDFHMQGKAIDIVGPDMPAMADWIASNYPGSLELIHGNGFGRNIDEGQNVGDGMAFFGADTMAGHNDHVHWAMASAPSVGPVEPGAGGGLPTVGGAGGASGAGASGPGGSGTNGGSAGPGTGTRPPGTATPVWVDNWPANFGAAAPSSTTPGVGGTTTDPAAPAVGGPGVEQHYGAGQPLAATPEQAADPWGEWAKGATDGFHKYLEGNWKEMLDSALSVVGMGASGQGGNTYNLIGPDPRQAAMAIERVQRRMTAAARRSGGFGR